jgi:hypothetical protein
MKKVERPKRVGLARYAGSSMRVEGAEVDVRLAGARAGTEKKQSALEAIGSRVATLGSRFRMLTDDVQGAADRLAGPVDGDGISADFSISGGIIGDINAGLSQLDAVADRLLGEIDRLKAAI